MLTQTYGLLGRLLEEGNHIHMVVRHPSSSLRCLRTDFLQVTHALLPDT